MLLAIDVGNSETAIGLFRDKKLVKTWRLTTATRRTEDEWHLLIESLLKSAGSRIVELSGVCVSSVVPIVTSTLEKIFDEQNLKLVDLDNSGGLTIQIDNPTELGSDRIANAIAAYSIYGKHCIIADFGTATTIDAVSAAGIYLGGSIAPGIGISAEALFKSGAQLNQTMLSAPKTILGKNTADSLRSGIVYGSAYQAEGLAKAIVSELGWNDVIYIATGGLSGFIFPSLKKFDIHDPNLTLKGLQMIFNYAR